MKRILLTSIIILTSILSYSQEQKQDYIKLDDGTLGIQTTTITGHTREKIESMIDDYNRRMESLFMEREEWVKLLDQCDKLKIVVPQDTVGQQVTDKSIPASSSILGTGHLKLSNINPNAVGGPDKPDIKASGETKKAKKKK